MTSSAAMQVTPHGAGKAAQQQIGIADAGGAPYRQHRSGRGGVGDGGGIQHRLQAQVLPQGRVGQGGVPQRPGSPPATPQGGGG